MYRHSTSATDRLPSRPNLASPSQQTQGVILGLRSLAYIFLTNTKITRLQEARRPTHGNSWRWAAHQIPFPSVNASSRHLKLPNCVCLDNLFPYSVCSTHQSPREPVFAYFFSQVKCIRLLSVTTQAASHQFLISAKYKSAALIPLIHLNSSLIESSRTRRQMPTKQLFPQSTMHRIPYLEWLTDCLTACNHASHTTNTRSSFRSTARSLTRDSLTRQTSPMNISTVRYTQGTSYRLTDWVSVTTPSHN